MITIDKINVYKRFNGDVDGWARIRTDKENSIMNDNDWFLIDSLIQDITLVNKCLASDSVMKSINERLKDYCDTDETIQAIRELV